MSKRPYRIDPKKLALIRRKFGLDEAADEAAPRVQKNLRILERDAARLERLAKRDGRSQAGLLAAALDAYEQTFGKLR